MWSTPGLLLITNLLSVNALSRRQEDGSRLLGSSIGYMRPGSLSDAQASESTVDALFEAAGRQPNETRSVSFNFDPGNLSESNADTTWTWLVNTTDLAVPEQVIPGDLRVVNQQWALQWPGGGNLESALNRWGIEGNRTQQLCIGAATWSLLPNVTSRYVDAEPGDCSAVLGTDCADRIRTQSLIGLDGRCGALSGRFDECADSIGSNTGGSLGTGSGFGRANSSDTFYFETSPALPADELEEYYMQAETSLQVLLVKDVPTPGQSTSGQLLCQVVNPPVSSGAFLRPDGYVMGFCVMAIVWGSFFC